MDVKHYVYLLIGGTRVQWLPRGFARTGVLVFSLLSCGDKTEPDTHCASFFLALVINWLLLLLYIFSLSFYVKMACCHYVALTSGLSSIARVLSLVIRHPVHLFFRDVIGLVVGVSILDVIHLPLFVTITRIISIIAIVITSTLPSPFQVCYLFVCQMF